MCEQCRNRAAVTSRVVELVNAENGLAEPITADNLHSRRLYVVTSSRTILRADDATAHKFAPSIVGCVQIRHPQWYQAEVCYAAVKAEFRRRGLMKLLMQRVLRHVREDMEGVAVLQATTRRGSAMEGYFRSHDWRPTIAFDNARTGHSIQVWQRSAV